ncbi:MAG: ribonuclease HI [Desulfobacteria bacterium]
MKIDVGQRTKDQWKRMMFKDHKVYLSVDKDGNPLIKNNKVLIKYQIDHDYEYYVSPEAVQPIDPRRLKKKKQNKVSKRPRGFSGSPPLVPERGAITIYTDGASSGNPGPSGIGIHLRYGDKEKEISEYIGTATNNIAELSAIKVALESVKTTDIPVRLHTDSQYCYGLLLLGWKPKKNIRLVTQVKLLMKRFKDIKIIKVKGHSGIPDNERADQLARAALSINRS